MINLSPQQIKLILDSINLITIKGSDAKFIAELQNIVESYLESKLEELNLEESKTKNKPNLEPLKKDKKIKI